MATLLCQGPADSFALILSETFLSAQLFPFLLLGISSGQSWMPAYFHAFLAAWPLSLCR